MAKSRSKPFKESEEKGESSTKDGNDVGETGILKIQKNLNIMAESLRCPLCLSILNNPCVLPCLHAICSFCTSKPLKNRCSNCPVCNAHYAKRSVRPSKRLEEIVTAFKKTNKAFGGPETQVEGTASRDTDMSHAQTQTHANLSRLWKDEFEKRAGDSALYSHKLSKRRRLEPSSHRSKPQPPQPQPSPSSDDNLHALATTHYQTLFQNAHRKKIYYIVITAVDDDVKRQVDSLVTIMKQKHFTLKIQKDLTLQTDLCITAPAPTTTRRCQHRTLKTMRAALLGIPIVTPRYLSRCLDEKTMIAPDASETYCVESLPTKAALLDQGAGNAVLRYAAHPSPAPLFTDTYVLLCGAWEKGKGPKKKDVFMLLKDGGATVLPSPRAMSKKIQSLKDSPETHCIVLCDDSTTDERGGITYPLFETVQNALVHLKSIKVVASAWLFDSISCGCVLSEEKLRFYPPLSPRAKSLWKECCT